MLCSFKSINSVINKEHSDTNDSSIEAVTESATSNSGTDTVIPASDRKKLFTQVDETKLSKEEAERLSTKRAYNRECAVRARKRSKDMVKDLFRQVEELQNDKNELRRTLTTMEVEIYTLKETNKILTVNRFAQGADTYSHLNVGMNTVSPLNIYSPQQSFSTLSLLSPLSHHGDGCHENIGLLLSSWDYQKLLLLQQLRK